MAAIAALAPVVATSADLPPELAARVPFIAARAAAWAEGQAAAALGAGVALESRLQEMARAVGVRDPQRIRLLVVDALPEPDETVLVAAAARAGIAPSTASAMTLGYAVIVRREKSAEMRLLAHEFRHVAQYEQAGGIRAFLAVHIPHLLAFGYEDSPYEVDARAHEVAARR